MPPSPPLTEPSDFKTRSGFASAFRRSSKMAECGPGPSPGASSTTVAGMSLAVVDVEMEGFRELESATTAISSGTASPSRSLYASVPGTSPYDGLLSTLSTRVLGIGLAGADWASVNWSSESDDSAASS